MRVSEGAAALLLQQLCKKKSTFPAIQEFSWAQHCPSRGLRKIWTKLHSTSLRSRVLSGSKIRYSNQGIILALDPFWSPRVQGEYKAMQTTKTTRSIGKEATEATAVKQQHHRRSRRRQQRRCHGFRRRRHILEAKVESKVQYQFGLRRVLHPQVAFARVQIKVVTLVIVAPF